MRLATRAAAAAGITAGLVAAVLGATSPAWAADPPQPAPCGSPPPTSSVGAPTNVMLTTPTSPITVEVTTLKATATPFPLGKPIGTVQVAICQATDPSHPGPPMNFTLQSSGVNEFSAVVPTLTVANGAYTFTVTATDAAGATNSSTSSETLNAPPQAPQNVVATPAPDGHSVDVSWKQGLETDIAGYTVERKSNGQDVTVILGPNATSYHDPNTSPGVMYTYLVRDFRPDLVLVTGKPLTSIGPAVVVATTPSSSPSAGNKPGGVQGSHGGGARIGGGGGVTGSLGGGGGGSLRIGNGGVTGSFSKPSLGTSKPITGAPTLGGFQGTLPYGQSSVALGGQPNASRSTSPAKEDGPHGYPVWTIALAVLLLAAAGFLFTLRRRIAKEKPALEPVQTSRRPAMRTSGTDFTNPRR